MSHPKHGDASGAACGLRELESGPHPAPAKGRKEDSLGLWEGEKAALGLRVSPLTLTPAPGPEGSLLTQTPAPGPEGSLLTPTPAPGPEAARRPQAWHSPQRAA